LLAFVRQLFQRYPAVHQLLENEQDIITSGAYTPTATDPEHTNPFASSAWELATLKFHIHPAVVYHAKGAAAQRMLQLPAEDPGRIRADLIGNSREGYIAYTMSKKKHPLSAKGGKDKRRRQQYRFITPRETDNYHLK
jgi:nucleolar complex protein 3